MVTKDRESLTSLLFSHPPLFEEDYSAWASIRTLRAPTSRSDSQPLGAIQCGRPTNSHGFYSMFSTIKPSWGHIDSCSTNSQCWVNSRDGLGVEAVSYNFCPSEKGLSLVKLSILFSAFSALGYPTWSSPLLLHLIKQLQVLNLPYFPHCKSSLVNYFA